MIIILGLLTNRMGDMSKTINEQQVNKNILAAFDKIMTIYRLSLWDIGKVENISPTQIQFIEFTNDNPENLCTLTNIAKEFDLTKPTVSDSIRNLEKKGYINKKTDKNDARVQYFSLTGKGAGIINKIKSRKDRIFDMIGTTGLEEKIIISSFLTKLILNFYQDGTIQSARTCLNCYNFVKNANPLSDSPHYCSFAKIYMAEPELRTYCTVFKEKN